jgi:cysteine desulfurase
LSFLQPEKLLKVTIAMIYLDHNATTPVRSEVQETFREAMNELWGNPSSTHSLGRKAFARLETARERLASILGASSKELLFTSGGTESDNLAILGIADQWVDGNIVISAIEHPAVHDAAQSLKARGIEIREAPVDENGVVAPDSVLERVDNKTRLVSVMYANNEIGSVQPIREIGETLAVRGIPFHCDAVQAFGKVPVEVDAEKVALLSISSHKIYGPKGCGALYVRSGTLFRPRTFGGGQERGLRTGTQNLPAILGFVHAAELATQTLEADARRISDLTEMMFQKIVSRIENVIRNGHPLKKIAGTLSVCIPGAETESLLASLDQEGICASGGAACSSGSVGASRTLLAIGRRKIESLCTVRFSIGRNNTAEEIDTAVNVLERITRRIRQINQ